MMQLKKYIWLINTIKHAGRISFEEISERWEANKDLSDYTPLSRSTFNRWKEAIYSNFGIVISCVKSGGYYYYIDNAEDLKNDEVRNWILNTFAVGNIINENLSLKDRILVDDVLSAHVYLDTLLTAMREDRVVEITYRSFVNTESSTFLIEPYCVKLFENRWYVLARSSYCHDIRTYGLDRIIAAKITDQTFKVPEDFNAASYFSNVYGIVKSNNEPVRIVIRAFKYHINYLKSLPLHHSQKLLEDKGDYADFELFLAPAYDFLMKLFYMGPKIEVISPASLRNEMKNTIDEVFDLYKND